MLHADVVEVRLMKRESRVNLLTWHVLGRCLVVSFPLLCKTSLLLVPASSCQYRSGSCEYINQNSLYGIRHEHAELTHEALLRHSSLRRSNLRMSDRGQTWSILL